MDLFEVDLFVVETMVCVGDPLEVRPKLKLKLIQISIGKNSKLKDHKFGDDDLIK